MADQQFPACSEDGLPLAPIPRLLTGQKAVVTGGSSGIGRATAIAMGESGADVVVNYLHREEEAREVVEKIEQYGSKAIAVQCDVSREKDVKRLFERTIEEFGRVDILFGNAGIQADHPIEEMTLEDWKKVLEVNLTGQFLCAREAVAHFRKEGVNHAYSCSAGKIVFNSSVHETIPWSGRTNYAASKGGLELFMKSLALEVAPEHIRVNSVAPGAIRTNINRKSWDGGAEQMEQLLAKIPSNRMGDPRDIARAVVWLASDQADYITGTTLFIDGGMTLYPSFAEGG